jgi:integrase
VASVFKPAGKSKYSIEYTDENGRRRKATGTTDKAVSERITNDLENKVALRKAGIVDPRAEAYAKHAAVALADHLDAWVNSLRSRGATAQHVKQHSSRARRVVALFKGARLVDIEPAKAATKTGVAKANAELRTWVSSARIADLTPENVQRSLALLIKEGRSLQTANHHRNAIKSFGKWLYETHRIREPILRGVAGYNVTEDPRHERRTLSVDELRQLIEAARTGKQYKNMTGPMRALCYRLAINSGLRYSEIGSIFPESFDWDSRPASVTVRAAYANNGKTATLPVPDDLASDMRAYLGTERQKRTHPRAI